MLVNAQPGPELGHTRSEAALALPGISTAPPISSRHVIAVLILNPRFMATSPVRGNRATDSPLSISRSVKRRYSGSITSAAQRRQCRSARACTSQSKWRRAGIRECDGQLECRLDHVQVTKILRTEHQRVSGSSVFRRLEMFACSRQRGGEWGRVRYKRRRSCDCAACSLPAGTCLAPCGIVVDALSSEADSSTCSLR
jgi:hypothetical protein